jgi:predicted DNA-binding transcriptional regulator AlpA
MTTTVRATLTAAEVSSALGVSTFTLYQTVRDGTCPIPPIRIGARRLVWPRTALERLLGLEPGSLVPAEGPPPSTSCKDRIASQP